MTRIEQRFTRTLLAAALAGVFAPAIAAEDELKELVTPESFLSLGVGNWNRTRPQGGIYDGMRQEGLYGLIDGSYVRRNNDTGTWLRFDARNLGLDTRELRGEWLRQGDMGLTIDYSRTPRTSPQTVQTPLRGIGTNSFVVSGSGVNALPGGEATLGTRRDLVQFGFFKNFSPGLELKVNLKNEEKTGNRMWGRGSAPEFIAEPIDSTTRQLETALEYVTPRLQLSGGWNYTSYMNSIKLVDTIVQGANPAVLANHTYLSQPLDNQSHQLFLNGGFSVTTGTRLTLKLAQTRVTQDENLPTAGVPGLALATAPTKLGGRFDTTLAQLGVTSRISPSLSLLGNLRYYNLEDKTTVARYVETGAGTCATTLTCVDNTPLSFKTLTGKFEANYRLPMSFVVIGGIDRVNQDRTVPVGAGSIDATGMDRQRYVPFRSDVDETTYRLQLRRSMSETINGAVAVMQSKRKGSQYSRTNEPESDEINPIHIADRTRNKVRLTLDWTPTERLGFTVNLEDARDKYPQNGREYGLRDGSAVLYSLDVSYALGEKWKLSGWYARDRTKAHQFNQRAPNGGVTDTHMEDRLEDTGDTLGLGVRGDVMPRVKVGADLLWVRSVGKYKQDIDAFGPSPAYPAGASGPLPDVNNRMTRVRLFSTYALQKNVDLRFDFIVERWRTDDWTWTFGGGAPFTYGTTTDNTTVLTTPKYTSTFLGARYIYRF